MKKIKFIIICFAVFQLFSCKRDKNYSDSELINNKTDSISFENSNQKSDSLSKGGSPKLAKAVFLLENSASMFGYVNGYTEYVDVVSDIAEKPRFAEENTSREFYFVNGGDNLEINKIGANTSILKDKLNEKGFNQGDITKSNLNSMFQLALSKAVNDTISILISDGIYDIGKPQAPMNALATEGRETRTRFIQSLNRQNIQTLVIKLNSYFDGYYYPVRGGRVQITQNRPYYIWVFGKNKHLNNYFGTNYIKNLEGYSNSSRFLKLTDYNIPYQVITSKKIGDFKFDMKNKNKLLDANVDRNGRGFQFSFTTDLSSLPFNDDYLNNTDNYKSYNSNFDIVEATNVKNEKFYGLGFKPTNIISVFTNKNPAVGNLKVSISYNLPEWIINTNSNEEDKITNDHTYGFRFLMDGISEAYEYKNMDSDLVNFKFEITN